MLGRKSRDWGSEKGQTGTETAVLVGLVAIGLIIAVFVLRGAIVDAFVGSGQEAGGAFRPPSVQCDPSYTGVCLPAAPPKYTCRELTSLGFTTPITLSGDDDPHGLDTNGNGIGCDE